MAKILMITSRNIVDHNGNSTGVGAATLIFRRASALFEIFDTKTFLIPLNGQVKHSYTGHEGCEFVHNKGITTKESITSFIREQKPEVIIFSGEKSYYYYNHTIKILNSERVKSKIIIDLHGALEEGIEYQTGVLLIKAYVRYYLKRHMFKSISSNAHGFLVVSNELRDHYSNLIPEKNFDKNFYKIRCGVNEVISNEVRLKWRQDIRQKLGIKDNTTIFVYSGYRAEWQCIEEIIKNFKIIDTLRNNVFFLMLTKTDESFDELLKESFPKANYYAGLVSHNQIFEYLSACDVGMLIRDDNFTNRVAFPNKFSDYINAGLSIVISPSLREPTRLLEKYNVPHIKLNPEDNISNEDLSIIEKRNANISCYYDVCNLLCERELLYSSQIKNQYKEFDTLIGAKKL